MDVTTLVGQFSPLAAAVGLLSLMATALFKGWLIPRGVAERMFAQWQAVDDLREAARKEERDQMLRLMQQLTEALK